MIIPENREKVKRKAIALINKLRSEISKPIKKFILEMTLGMQMTGSCNVNPIAGVLQEETEVKYTLKRLHRMLLNSKIFHLANKLVMVLLVKTITLYRDMTNLLKFGVNRHPAY